jgi:hypothetical protein
VERVVAFDGVPNVKSPQRTGMISNGKNRKTGMV